MDLTIDNTQKYIKEKALELSRNMTQNMDNNDDKNKDDKNHRMSQIDFDDLPYEKEIKEKKLLEKKRKEDLDKQNKELKKLSKYINTRGNKSVRKKEDKKKDKNDFNRSDISNVLSFFDDLSLSRNEEDDPLKRKGTNINNLNKYLYEFDDYCNKEKKFINKISFRIEEKKDMDITNKSLISNDSG